MPTYRQWTSNYSAIPNMMLLACQRFKNTCKNNRSVATATKTQTGQQNTPATHWSKEICPKFTFLFFFFRGTGLKIKKKNQVFSVLHLCTTARNLPHLGDARPICHQQVESHQGPGFSTCPKSTSSLMQSQKGSYQIYKAPGLNWLPRLS